VTLLLLLGTLSALGLLTLLHLRPTGARAARAVPSLQHLRGLSPRRRRALPLEEAVPWALRGAALLLALGGAWVSRAGCARDSRPLVLVDPSAGAVAWEKAEGLLRAKALLGFAGEAPRVDGDVPARATSVLEGCSDTRAACLLRAADTSNRPLVLVGTFAAAEWRPALARRGRSFSFLRAGKALAPPVETAAPAGLVADIRLEGTSTAAEVWAAALAVASVKAAVPGGTATATPPVVAVVDGETLPTAKPSAALTVVAVDTQGPAQPDGPTAVARPGVGLLLPDPLDLAADVPGLGLSTPLAFSEDARFPPLLGLAALRKTKATSQLFLAATPEALGSWAHEGSLVPLARALLAAGLPPPLEVSRAPAGGALGWTDAAGRPAPVGLLDVHPGQYLRADGLVSLRLSREVAPGLEVLDDAALEALGGHPYAGLGPRPLPFAEVLFCLALAAWLAGAFLTWKARRARPLALAVAVGVSLFALDVAWPTTAEAPFAVALALPGGPLAEDVSSLAKAAHLTAHPGTDAMSLACAAASATRPCTPLSTVGPASAPAAGMDVLLFDTGRPRVDVLSVQAPREVPLGTSAEIWVTVRVRRAGGRRVTLTAHSTAAAPTLRELALDGEDVVRTVQLSITPLAEGVSFVAVEARVEGEVQAQDGRLLALSARKRLQQRLLLAAAPGWEARAATEALEATGARVQSLTLLGARAVVASGRPPEAPQQLLAGQGALSGVGLLTLVGFGKKDLDAASLSGLRHYVESGGAALLLDAPGAAAALGVELKAVAESAALQPLSGQLASEEAVHFRGYAPSASVRLPAGIAVLGRLGTVGDKAPLPWVLGRALGKGRVAVVTAPDMWRLSPPGKGREAYQRLLSRLVGWLEAPASSRAGVVLSEDWTSLQLQDEGGAHLVPLPATSLVGGLRVDALDVETLLRWPRARLRAAAAAVRHPFLELEGPAALGAAWRRLPPAPSLTMRLPLRASDAAFLVLYGLLVLEAMARRLYPGAGDSGSRARTGPSSGDTGGTDSGEGNSQRASATPASRAAALRAASSFAA
jgi:hypothetical protein